MSLMKNALVIIMMTTVQIVWSQTVSVNEEGCIGIQGYDPVAYFIEEKAIPGDKSIESSFEGITYRFVDEKNKALFIRDPQKYLPQYGGWCAYAMAGGEKVRIDPETFKLKDGKLYLFYNFYFNNTLKTWNKDEKRLMQQADQQWEQLAH